MNKKNIFARLLENIDNSIPAVMYTVLDASGSSEVKATSRLLVTKNGEIYGSLGEEALDQEMQRRAENVFTSAAPEAGIIETNIPGRDNVNIKILEDPHYPQKKLVIFGGGHIAVPLQEIASVLGYSTVIIDDREDFASRERFPGASEVICASFEEVLARDFIEAKIDSSTAVVIVTRGHKYDKNCLASVIDSPAYFTGMIGSKKKVEQNFKSLMAEGVSKEKLQKVSSPTGLDLGGQKPAEIALSIMAEIVARENNGTGRPLKEIKGGIL